MFNRLLAVTGIGVVLACIAALACIPAQTTKSEIYQPKVRVVDLVLEYHHGKNRDGKRVELTLAPKSYTVVPNVGIHWHTVLPATSLPPTIVFICTPPPDNSRFIELTGTVRGVERDEIDRGSGIKFTISVDVTGLVLR